MGNYCSYHRKRVGRKYYMRAIKVHDINNKIAVIDGFSEMLMDTQLTETQLRYIKEIKETNNEINLILQQELELYQSE